MFSNFSPASLSERNNRLTGRRDSDEEEEYESLDHLEADGITSYSAPPSTQHTYRLGRIYLRRRSYGVKRALLTNPHLHFC